MMAIIRSKENYPDLQIAPYVDAQTKASFPLAVYTSGSITISSRSKSLTYEVDVYASIEAFEAGGNKIGTPICQTINNTDTVPLYDEVIAGNAQLVGGILQALSIIEAQRQAAAAAAAQ